jgi:hypothetical protein
MQLSVALDGIPEDWHIKPRLDRVLEIMNQGIAKGRNAIEGLRSTDYRTLDLVLALSRVQQELPAQPHVDFRVIVAGKQKPLQAPIRQPNWPRSSLNAFCHSGGPARRVRTGICKH